MAYIHNTNKYSLNKKNTGPLDKYNLSSLSLGPNEDNLILDNVYLCVGICILVSTKLRIRENSTVVIISLDVCTCVTIY